MTLPAEHHFPDAACSVPVTDDRDEVVRFARGVRDAYFADGDKIIDDPDERALYDALWEEYDALLARHDPG